MFQSLQTHQDSAMELSEEEIDITEIGEMELQVQTRRTGKRLLQQPRTGRKVKQSFVKWLRISPPSSLISSTA